MTRFFIGALTILTVHLSGVAAPIDRPNIVLFFVDDFGPRDLACYGSTLYETPNMDQLAADGVRFLNAYTAYPRCVPSRKALLSGKYPFRINAPIKKTQPYQLPLSEVTFGEVLQEAGYKTCYIGKWHEGGHGGGPENQGFETVVHSGHAGGPHSYFFPFDKDDVANPVVGKEGDYLTDVLTDKAVEFIEDKKADPFLMVLAHYAVHTPIQAPADLTEKYRKKLKAAGINEGGTNNDADLITDRKGRVKTVQNNPTYAAMIESVDASLGRIMQTLKTSGIEKNTAIILISDHGGLSTCGLEKKRILATSNYPLRQGKGSVFEGGIRIPMIVKWAGVTKPGTVSTVQVTGTDHYPTILEIACLPLLPKQHVDGVSYVKALRGENYQRPGLFFCKYNARPDSTGDTRAAAYIEGRYKVIEWLDEDIIELFDLQNDEGEQVNLAKKMPEKTQKLLNQMHKIEATFPGDKREEGRMAAEKRQQRKGSH